MSLFTLCCLCTVIIVVIISLIVVKWNNIQQSNNNVNNNTHLMGLCPGQARWAGTRKVKPICIYWSKTQWVAVASAGSYANLHLAPNKSSCQHPTIQFFTGWMPFLPPNQQRQSTWVICIFLRTHNFSQCVDQFWVQSEKIARSTCCSL